MGTDDLNDWNWPFDTPRNTAVITMRSIMQEGAPILFASLDDQGWQFVDMVTEPTMENALVVGLGEIVSLDESVGELADLPMYWQASRESRSAPWQRRPDPNYLALHCLDMLEEVPAAGMREALHICFTAILDQSAEEGNSGLIDVAAIRQLQRSIPTATDEEIASMHTAVVEALRNTIGDNAESFG